MGYAFKSGFIPTGMLSITVEKVTRELVFGYALPGFLYNSLSNTYRILYTLLLTIIKHNINNYLTL